MRRIELQPGEVYGELTVVKEAYSPKKRKYLCKCSCGNETKVRLDHLRTGHTTSCGRCGVEYKGVRKTLVEWARLYGIKESTLRFRLKTMKMKDALGMGKPR